MEKNLNVSYRIFRDFLIFSHSEWRGKRKIGEIDSARQVKTKAGLIGRKEDPVEEKNGSLGGVVN
jgi:hypothetical protein